MESRRRNSEMLDQQERGGLEERKSGMDCGTEQICTHSFEKKLTLSCLLLKISNLFSPCSKRFDTFCSYTSFFVRKNCVLNILCQGSSLDLNVTVYQIKHHVFPHLRSSGSDSGKVRFTNIRFRKVLKRSIVLKV